MVVFIFCGMIYFLIIPALILTVALCTGGILIASQLKITYKQEAFSSLLLYLIFYFTFGFYALWGQQFINSVFASGIDPLLLLRINEFFVLIGAPFLVFASLMFIKFSREVSGLKTNNLFVIIYLSVNILFIFSLGYFFIQKRNLNFLYVIRYYFLVLMVLYTLISIYYFLFSAMKQKYFQGNDFRKLSIVLLLMIIILSLTRILSDEEGLFIQYLYLFLFFLNGAQIPFFIKYQADLSDLITKDGTDISIIRFCEKYTISKREKEIIIEICEGLSNKQIADKLFISLQTVKDHTHRIYSKTGCTGRAQLIKMITKGQ